MAFQTLDIALGLCQIAAQRVGVRLQSGDFLVGSRQISLQAADLAVQALLLRLRFGIGVVQLLRQGGGTGFQRGRFVFGIIQGALEQGDAGFQSGDLSGQGFVFLKRGVQAVFQGDGFGLVGVGLGLLLRQRGAQLRQLQVQAVPLLLRFRLGAVQLLRERGHPFFHGLGVVLGFFQRGVDGGNIRLQGGGLRVQRVLFLARGVQGFRQGGNLGLIGFVLGAQFGQRGLQLVHLGGLAVAFLLGVRFQRVCLLGEGADLFLKRLFLAFREFQGGVHGDDVRFQGGDAAVQGVRTGLIIAVLGFLFGQRGLHVRELLCQGVFLFQNGGGGFPRGGQFRVQRRQAGVKFIAFCLGGFLSLGQIALEAGDFFLQGVHLAGEGVLFLVRRVQRCLNFVDAALQLGVVRLHLIYFRAVACFFVQRGVQRLDHALGVGQLGGQLFGFILQGRCFLGAGFQGGFGFAQFFLQPRPFLVAQLQRLVQGFMLFLQRFDLLLHFFRGQHIPVGGGTGIRRGTIRLQAGADQHAAGHQRDADDCQDHDHPLFFHSLSSSFSVLPFSPEQDKKPLFPFFGG